MGESHERLGTRAVSGVKWTALSSITTGIIQYVQVFALSQFVTPGEFGLIAILFICYAVGMAFCDGGTGNYIVQRTDLTALEFAAIRLWNICWGCAVCATFWISAPLIARIFAAPAIRPLLRLLAASFCIAPLGTPALFRLQRSMRFRALCIIESAGKLAGLAIIITGGVRGMGMQAAIVGIVADSAVRAVGAVLLSPESFFASLKTDARLFARFVQFGFYQMGERLSGLLSERLDQLLIGALIGPRQLGYYSLAHTITVQPLLRINPVLNRVSLPLLARVQDDPARLSRIYFSTLKALSIAATLILGLMAALSSAYMPWIFGEQWRPAAPIVSALCIVSFLRTITNPNGNLLLARGMASRSFHFSIGLFGVQTPLIVAGAYYWGVWGVIAGLLLVQCAFLYLEYKAILEYILGPCLDRVVEAVVFPFTACLAMAAGLAGFVSAVSPVLPNWGAALAGGALGTAFYAGVLYFFKRESLYSAFRFVRQAVQ